MDYGLAVVSRTGTEDPVSLTEIKAHVRQDHDADNTVLSDLVSAASETVEDAQSKVFRKATMTLTLPHWPASGVIKIPRYPVVSVDSVTYLEEGESSATTLAASNYRVETDHLPPRIVLLKNKQWPSASLEAGMPIAVNFTAGYADGAVPEKSKHAIKLLVGYWYNSRESVVTGTIATELPEAFRSLVLRDRLW